MQLTELQSMLNSIVSRYGRLGYEPWMRIISGVWSEIPFDESYPVLNSAMPEEKPGEYLRKYLKRLKDVSMGTVIYMAKECGYTGKITTSINYVRPEKKISAPIKDVVDDTFDVIELVQGSPKNRIGDFRHLDSSKQLDGMGEPGLIDVYHSIYSHTLDLPAYYEVHKSIQGYAEACKARCLHFDFDSKENPQIALEDVRIFINRACSDYCIPEGSIQVWFSGAKGFSVFIYDKSVTDSHGATDVPERVKNTCSRMAEGIATFDPTPYDRCRIWRVQNTINSKTGLYKIPLTINEIMSWNIDTIKECAKNQRSF